MNVLYIPCSKLLNEPYIEKESVDDTKTAGRNFLFYLATKLKATYSLLLDKPSNNAKAKLEQISAHLNDIFNSNKWVIVMDDAHIIFGAKNFLTYALKDTSNLVLCMTTYLLHTVDYNGSPAELEFKQSLETVNFNGFEFDEVINNMINNIDLIDQHVSINPDWFSDLVRDEIFRYTGGYPCLVFRSIRHIMTESKLNLSDPNELYNKYFGKNLYKYYDVIKLTAGSRCFPSIMELNNKLIDCLKNLKELKNPTNIEHDALSLLQRCLHKLIVLDPLTTTTFYSDDSFSQPFYDLCLKLLLRTCICGKKKEDGYDHDTYFFWSFIFRQVYTDEYMKSFGPCKPVSVETVDYFKSADSEKRALFVQSMVSLFSSSLLTGVLTKSVSTDKQTLLEAPYDRLVYLSLKILGFSSISAQWNQNRSDKGIFNHVIFHILFRLVLDIRDGFSRSSFT